MVDELLAETSRRHPDVKRMFYLLRGMRVPFSLDELKKRVSDAPEGFKLNYALEILWSSGIIGIQITSSTEKATQLLRHNLGTDGLRVYEKGNNKLYKWTFFEYNRDGEPLELMDHYGAEKDIDVQLVLHPKTFESLLPHVSMDSPVGA